MQKMIIVCDGCSKEENMVVITETMWRTVEAKGSNGMHEAHACSSACEPKAFLVACAYRDRALAHDAAHHAFAEAMTQARRSHDNDDDRRKEIADAHLIETEAKKVADQVFKKTVGRDP